MLVNLGKIAISGANVEQILDTGHWILDKNPES